MLTAAAVGLGDNLTHHATMETWYHEALTSEVVLNLKVVIATPIGGMGVMESRRSLSELCQ